MSCETIAVIHGCHRREKIRLLWNWSFLFLLSHSALLSLFLCCILMAQVVVFKEEIIPIPEIAEYYSLQGTLCSFFSHFFLSSILLLYNDTINIYAIEYYSMISSHYYSDSFYYAGLGEAGRLYSWSMSVSTLDGFISFREPQASEATEIAMAHVKGSGSGSGIPAPFAFASCWMFEDWRLLNAGWMMADAVLGTMSWVSFIVLTNRNRKRLHSKIRAINQMDSTFWRHAGIPSERLEETQVPAQCSAHR